MSLPRSVRTGMRNGDRSALPNLLFVFSDQHRACDIGCYGNSEMRTPHLDAFARGGLRFTRCLSNSPVCVPARGSLLTGLFPWHHRAIANDLPVRPDARSIAHVLGEGGRHPGYIGKWHLGGVPRDRFIPAGERLGFRSWKAWNCSHNYSAGYYFDEENRCHEMAGHAAIAETDLAIDFVRRRRGEPWSLHLSWEPPHDPYQDVPPRFRALYDGARLTLRPNTRFPAIRTRSHRIDEGAMRESIAGYYALVTLLDEQFGRLMAALDETGQRESTLVVYTSDHGDLLGSHGYCDKQLPYAESVNVPLLISGPGVAPGECAEPIGLTDLPVSLASHLGCPWNAAADGDDLSILFTDRAAAGPAARLIFDLIPVHQAAARGGFEWMGAATRDETWAMTVDGRDWVHFDDAADPCQQINLAESGAAPDRRCELRRLTGELLDRHGYRFRPWERMLREDGLRDEWNRSQAYFGLPRIE